MTKRKSLVATVAAREAGLRALATELAEALTPFVERAKAEWNNEMDGDWPIEVIVTVADCRRAAAALTKYRKA